MKWRHYILWVIFFTSLMVIDISCKIKNVRLLQNDIYYYPAKNIYYDSLRSKYFYSLNGAVTWDSMEYKTPPYATGLGTKVLIKRTAANVWSDNQLHRKIYNGVLLNIINDRTIALSRADTVVAARPKKIAVVKTRRVLAEKEPELKKGLGGFLRKLFGRKKKTADEKKPVD